MANRRQDPYFRKVGTYQVADGSTVQIDLPRDLDYSSILVRIDGTPTFGGTPTAKALPVHALFQNISLVANGSKQLFNGSGITACLKNRAANVLKNTNFSFTATSGTAFWGEFQIDQSIIDGIVPKDSQLPSGNLSSFKLTLQMDTLANASLTGGTTPSFTGTITVTAICVKEYPDAVSKKRFVPSAAQYVNELTIPATTSQTDSQITLITDTLQRQFLLYSLENGLFVDAITNVRIERAGVVLANFDRNSLKSLARRSQLDGTAAYGGDAVYVIDPTRFMGQARAKLSDGWDMRGNGGVAEQLYMYITFTGNTGRTIRLMQNYFQNYAQFISA